MNLFETTITKEAIENVNKVLLSEKLNQGPMVSEFECALHFDLGMKNPVTLNSCTSSLHLALLLSYIGPGDEVILPPQTFIATGLAILMCGAKPVFADVDQNGNLDPTDIERHITKKTKAVIVVHWGGVPAQMSELQKVCRAKGLWLIEDAAHAIGAKYAGETIGSCSLSDYCCFSLQAIKTLTTGDGGILCCKFEDKYNEAIRRRWFGIDKTNVVRNENGEREINVKELGFKYHMNDISAALGLGNLCGLEERINKRIAIANLYNQSLKDVSTPFLGKYEEPSYWLYTIRVGERDDFIKKLRSKGIPASVVDTRIDKNEIFGGPFELPGQKEFEEHQVSIPCHDRLTIDDVLLIIDTINSGW
jgi:perosamine synthetase